MGDGQTLNTDAFKKAIAAVEQAGGGKLVVPKGVFRTLPFVLCSSLDLHLDEGAVIQAPDSFAAYGLPDPATLKSQDEVREKVTTPAPLITGHNLHDVALTGPGTIDGNGAMWWAWSERAGRRQPGRIVYRRPHLIVINGCQRLLVADVTLTNSLDVPPRAEQHHRPDDRAGQGDRARSTPRTPTPSTPARAPTSSSATATSTPATTTS